MNYLADAFLSGDDPDFLMGNISADLIKGNLHKSLPEKISLGVIHHRKIDVFTDNHPDYKDCLPFLSPNHRKYAGVVADIFFDYFLIKNWNLYSEISIEEFSSKTNELLLLKINHLPFPIKSQLKSMIDGNWLLHYGHLDGLSYCFSRLAKRVVEPKWLLDWKLSLDSEGEKIEQSFLTFFPEMIQFSKNQAILQNVAIW